MSIPVPPPMPVELPEAPARQRTAVPWGAALGLPLLVGVLLAGRSQTWAPGGLAEASADRPLSELPAWADRFRAAVPTPAAEAVVPNLPVWADELHRLLPSQPDPVLTPLAVHGFSFPALCAVAAAALLASAVFLLIVARVAGMGEHARFGNALTCALHLKVLVLALHWGADTLTSLAPAETLATIGGPTVGLLGCGALAALLIVRADFRTDLSRSLVALGAALILPALVPVTLPFVFAPLVPSLWA